ncbi:hypothetical protein ABZ953_07130 [Streptomyces sp. NPDC046465]|uniref:hypothetical protein n=1 Tax=Streptomyces sp. NPDC046465 TaxID=3155810 RepID=UPI00340A1C38
MALVDSIEFYGRAVEDGRMTRAAAAKALAEDSAVDLTEIGAATSIDRWKTIRTTYEQRFKQAGRGWAHAHGIELVGLEQ